METNVLENARDIVVVENLDDGNYVYAAKPSLEIMKKFYEQSISNPSDAKVPVFQKYWKFDEQMGIKGSSTFLALRFDRQALRPNKLWIPSLLEAKVLDGKRELENGVYRDHGIIVFNEDGSNREITEVLIPQAKELEFPLIVPFKALDYVNNQNKELGIEVHFVESPTGIIQGKKAQDKMDSLDCLINSGVQRLLHSRNFPWIPVALNISDAHGQMDWICGEATSGILEKAHSELRERKYKKSIRKLEEKQIAEEAEFRWSLNK